MIPMAFHMVKLFFRFAKFVFEIMFAFTTPRGIIERHVLFPDRGWRPLRKTGKLK